MTDDDVTVWLVERSYDRDVANMLNLTYATPDGARAIQMERSLANPHQADTVTAGRRVEEDALQPVEDTERRERYAREVDRLRGDHEADDTV